MAGDEPELRDALRRPDRLPPGRPQRQAVDVHGVDERLLPVAQGAVADLAERLGLPHDEVRVVVLGTVTWSDRSCGCPRPGMRYPQVPVDGLYVRLEAGGRSWHYHGCRGRALFLCAT